METSNDNVTRLPVVIDAQPIMSQAEVTARVQDQARTGFQSRGTLTGGSAPLTRASREWAHRPADQRFLSLTDLHAATLAHRQRSKAKVVASRDISAQPDPSDDLNGLLVVGPNGAPVQPSHWAFGQLAQRAGAPAGYLRDLPAPLAADCINYGLKHSRDVEDLGVLLRSPSMSDERATLAAVTGREPEKFVDK